MSALPYCTSRFTTVRRQTRQVMVGPVAIGGDAPLVVQSMTTTPTQDVKATVAQSIRLAEAGCEVVRITAQNVKAAAALEDIRAEFTAAGFGDIPLVADIHFLPSAAMEAVKWVEKVRINPGNYADKKKFAQREYSDADYDAELERLHEAFSPIVLECKRLGRAMRIGTNHGSLSDRIMNRYGDTPLGMVESALEFIRIAESHAFRDIILSMKASNPKVAIEAYRLVVAKMAQEDMHYPLHLGVTEAGDGDDARIKSAIGIGSLLLDGLGDTIRVSLTEDPEAEIPVAKALADKAMAQWREVASRTEPDPIDPFAYRKRAVVAISPGLGKTPVGLLEPPRVIHPTPVELSAGVEKVVAAVKALQAKAKDAPVEGLLVQVAPSDAPRDLAVLRRELGDAVSFVVWDMTAFSAPADVLNALTTWMFDDGERFADVLSGNVVLVRQDRPEFAWGGLLAQLAKRRAYLALDIAPGDLAAIGHELVAGDQATDTDRLILTLSAPPVRPADVHPIGHYRQLAEVAGSLGLKAPIWLRATEANALDAQAFFGDRLLEASMLAGSLLCDGVGDFFSVETIADPAQGLALAYNILQGARTRTTKTEYVACPSCGRTLFDLQTTTQRIRAATGHLKGVTIAVMGCIVNGPGEMADADFGYVGGAPGKINLYVGKTPVKFNLPSAEAVDRLIDLIKEHGKWAEAEVEPEVMA